MTRTTPPLLISKPPPRPPAEVEEHVSRSRRQHEEFAAKHRHERLLEVAREYRCTTLEQLQKRALKDGLEPSVKDCGNVLIELFEEVKVWKRRSPHKIRPGGPGQLEVLMDVAAGLPQPFSRSALVVACWMAAPDLFGLEGHALPDAHRVQAALYAKRGPLASGEIVREGNGFRVEGR